MVSWQIDNYVQWWWNNTLRKMTSIECCTGNWMTQAFSWLLWNSVFTACCYWVCVVCVSVCVQGTWLTSLSQFFFIPPTLLKLVFLILFSIVKWILKTVSSLKSAHFPRLKDCQFWRLPAQKQTFPLGSGTSSPSLPSLLLFNLIYRVNSSKRSDLECTLISPCLSHILLKRGGGVWGVREKWWTWERCVCVWGVNVHSGALLC